MIKEVGLSPLAMEKMDDIVFEWEQAHREKLRGMEQLSQLELMTVKRFFEDTIDKKELRSIFDKIAILRS